MYVRTWACGCVHMCLLACGVCGVWPHHCLYCYFWFAYIVTRMTLTMSKSFDMHYNASYVQKRNSLTHSLPAFPDFSSNFPSPHIHTRTHTPRIRAPAYTFSQCIVPYTCHVRDMPFDTISLICLVINAISWQIHENLVIFIWQVRDIISFHKPLLMCLPEIPILKGFCICLY